MQIAPGRPTGRQSLPRGRLAGEAIKLQFHGLTPRKAYARGATLGDVVLSFTSRITPRLLPLIPLRISNGTASGTSLKMLCQIPSRRLSFDNLPCASEVALLLRLIRPAPNRGFRKRRPSRNGRERDQAAIFLQK